MALSKQVDGDGDGIVQVTFTLLCLSELRPPPICWFSRVYIVGGSVSAVNNLLHYISRL